jgi:hypothetical protein
VLCLMKFTKVSSHFQHFFDKMKEPAYVDKKNIE